MHRHYAQHKSDSGQAPLIRISAARKKMAQAAVTDLVNAGAEMLMSFGYAGGLEPGYGAGTLLLPKKVISADGKYHMTDPCAHGALAQILSQGQSNAVFSDGAIFGSDDPVLTAARKQDLYRRTGAVAVDMESHIMAQAANEAGLPFFVLRAISDPPGLEMPPQAMSVIKENGRIDIPALSWHLATHPWQLGVFIKMGGGAGAAAKALSQGLTAASSFFAAQSL